MFNLKFNNDFREPRKNSRRIIDTHLANRGEFSFSYIALLISATVVCTLGLITNSTAVIIGGMIIAPLMWPLLRISFGIAVKRTKISYQPFLILIISTLVIFFGAALVAFLSPYKQIGSEMLSRTSPTSLEIFIALAAAVIAALAITHPKITDSVAGVAVATSLVPPLCVSGIGVAYLNYELTVGGFLLYLTNTVTIMLVTTIIFTLFLFGKDMSSLKTRSVMAIIFVLILVSIPLYSQLNKSIATSSINSASRNTLVEELDKITPNSRIQDFSTSILDDGNKVSIRAIVLLPAARTITYEQQQIILAELENELGKDVDLQLVLQDSLELTSEQEIAESEERKRIEELLEAGLQEIDSSLILNTVNSQITEDFGWNIAASVRTSNSDIISLEDVNNIERNIIDEIGKNVEINLEIINSRFVGSDQSQLEQDQELISEMVNDELPSAKILEINLVKDSESNKMTVKLTLLIPKDFEMKDQMKNIKSKIAREFDSKVDLSSELIEYTRAN